MDFETLLILLAGGYALLQWLIRGAKKAAGGDTEQPGPDTSMEQAKLEVRRRTRLEQLKARRLERMAKRRPEQTAARTPADQGTEQFRRMMEQLFGVTIEGQGGPLGRSSGVELESAEEIEELEVLEGQPEVVSLETGGERLARVVVDQDDDAEALVRRRIAAAAARSGELTRADHARFDQRIRTEPASALQGQPRIRPTVTPGAPFTGRALRNALIWSEILGPPVSRRQPFRSSAS